MARTKVIAASGRPHVLSDLEAHFQGELAEMRRELADVLAEKPHYDCTIWMIRFLLNTKFTVPQCAKRYRDMIAERENHNVDDVMEAIKSGLRPSDFEFADMMQALLPERLFSCVDNWNQPCAIQFAGHVNPAAAAHLTVDSIMRFCIYRMEYIRLVLDTLSIERNQLLFWSSVISLEGFTTKSFSVATLKMYKAANVPVNVMYKDYCDKLFITHAGTTMSLLWKTIKTFFPKRTVDKVSLFGSKWQSKIVQFMPQGEVDRLLGSEDPNLTLDEIVAQLTQQSATKRAVVLT